MKKGANAAVVKGDMNAAIVKQGGIVPVNPWHEHIKKLKGMQRVMDLHQTPQCQDSCTKLYNKRKQEFDSKPKLWNNLIKSLKQILEKFDTTESNINHLASLARSALLCIEEDPETCPFKNEMIKQFLHAIKG